MMSQACKSPIRASTRPASKHLATLARSRFPGLTAIKASTRTRSCAGTVRAPAAKVIRGRSGSFPEGSSRLASSREATSSSARSSKSETMPCASNGATGTTQGSTRFATCDLSASAPSVRLRRTVPGLPGLPGAMAVPTSPRCRVHSLFVRSSARPKTRHTAATTVKRGA